MQSQVLKVRSEQKDRLSAQGDFVIAPEQQLSDIWHKALRHPNATSENENSGQSIRLKNYISQ